MPHPITIRKLVLPTPLLLAPVAGYTDLAFRLIARGCGDVGLACTDLLCPEAMVRESPRTLRLAATSEEDRPLAMQLYGSDPARLCEAAKWAVDHGADVVDLNMGCPADKILKKDGGAMLLCDPERTVRMFEQIRTAIPETPLTAKLRLGWDARQRVAPKLAKMLEDAGADLITVHGRTTEMRFAGQVLMDGIAEVVAGVSRIPVIGNGDIRQPEDAAEMFDRTGCHGVMIGREALSRPWIFRDTWAFLTTGTVPPEPTLEEKCGLMRKHFENLVRYRGERFAISEFRKRISWYAKTLHPCRELQEKVRRMETAGDLGEAIAEFLDWRGALSS